MLEIKRVKETVLLIGVMLPGVRNNDYQESMVELARLAETAGAEVADFIIQRLQKPNAGTYIGKGKLEQLKARIQSEKITSIIFNDNLSPSQARNIAEAVHCNVVDRTELILDIFARHAKTKQAKLQVELAQLEYNYSRLRNLWQHLSRIEGGIGFRGPGEKQIELDRREIQKKIDILKSKISNIEKTIRTQRKSRKDTLSIALVGYTNAGKSTLFNRLLKSQRYTADQLFATLDAQTRSLRLDTGENVVFTDTIGFIRQLPHALITSFHSTLMEVMEADLLIHVVDASHPRLNDNIRSVEAVLTELGADNKNILTVFNKSDKLRGTKALFIRKNLLVDDPHALFISARCDENLNPLFEKIKYFLSHKKTLETFYIPAIMKNLVAYLFENTEVIEDNWDEKSEKHVLVVRVLKKMVPGIQRQISKQEYDDLKFDTNN
ncbi:MAG: GTPase HflX [Candidatus Cloacimonetes bacterium]|nr:GTPase HflX [Candidatus Cloacimonadota bacterium]